MTKRLLQDVVLFELSSIFLSPSVTKHRFVLAPHRDAQAPALLNLLSELSLPLSGSAVGGEIECCGRSYSQVTDELRI